MVSKGDFNVRVMLLCAGFGKRMLPLTLNAPKPLLLFKNKPIIDHQLSALAQAGFQEIVINLAHLGEQIRNHVQGGQKWGLKVTYTPEPQPLEWGGGIVNALLSGALGQGEEPFAVVSGDLITAYDYQRLLLYEAALKSSETVAHCVLVPNPPFHPQGDFGLSGSSLSFDTETYYNYAGIAVLKPSVFNNVQPVPTKMLEVMRRYIEAGQVSGSLYQGPWQNVSVPGDLL